MQRTDVSKALRVNVTLDDARHQGWMYGEAGLARDCNPHPEGTALHRSWDVGWRSTASAASCERSPSTKG